MRSTSQLQWFAVKLLFSQSRGVLLRCIQLHQVTLGRSCWITNDDAVQVLCFAVFDFVDRRAMPFTGAFDQYFDGSAEELLIVLFADAVLHLQQFIVAAAFDIKRNIVRQLIVCLGTRSFAVLENEAVFESAFLNQINGLLKFSVRLTTEPDDKVARHGRLVAQRFVDPSHHVPILANGIATLHTF